MTHITTFANDINGCNEIEINPKFQIDFHASSKDDCSMSQWINLPFR